MKGIVYMNCGNEMNGFQVLVQSKCRIFQALKRNCKTCVRALRGRFFDSQTCKFKWSVSIKASCEMPL